MVITDYRVQSVLRTYSRQLQRSRIGENLAQEGQARKASAERVTISDEAKCRMIMERMTTQVLERACPQQEGSVGEQSLPK